MSPAHSKLLPPMASLGPNIFIGVRPRCPCMGPAQSELFPPMALLGPNIFFGGHPRYSRMGPEHSEYFPPMASFGPNIVSACSPDALVWAQHIQNHSQQCSRLGPTSSQRVPRCPSMGSTLSNLFTPMRSLGPDIVSARAPDARVWAQRAQYFL